MHIFFSLGRTGGVSSLEIVSFFSCKSTLFIVQTALFFLGVFFPDGMFLHHPVDRRMEDLVCGGSSGIPVLGQEGSSGGEACGCVRGALS